MPTLGARHTAVADGLVDAITAAWQPAEPDEVNRVETVDEILKGLGGRKVGVLLTEAGAREVERLSRGEVVNGFKLSLRLYEKFAEPGPPTVEWLDARRAWLDTVYTACDKITPGAYLLGSLWCQTLELTSATDADAVDELKLFVASLEVEFREVANG
jgi:hypothetical protein